MPPKFANPPDSCPADTTPLFQYSKSAPGNKNGALYIFKWQNQHGLHGAYNATHWVIWIGRNAGGGELYKTQTPIANVAGNVKTDNQVTSAALPVGEQLYVTPKYKDTNGIWNDGSSTKFKVVT